ncbi:pectinesterase inhibitor-like [Hibiscus syriacus]|nr:pectinesterase inhibitor-like [Hibiscus syriacus]
MGIALPLYTLILFLLSISFNHVGHRNLVSADEALIQSECHNADNPATCIRCVKSDPRGESADKVGIATIVLSCLIHSAEVQSANMIDLTKYDFEEDVKQMLLNCATGFFEAQINLTNATDLLMNKDYNGTNSLVKQALVQEVKCRRALENRHVTHAAMVYDMRGYEELSNAAMRIVDRF